MLRIGRVSVDTHVRHFGPPRSNAKPQPQNLTQGTALRPANIIVVRRGKPV